MRAVGRLGVTGFLKRDWVNFSHILIDLSLDITVLIVALIKFSVNPKFGNSVFSGGENFPGQGPPPLAGGLAP